MSKIKGLSFALIGVATLLVASPCVALECPAPHPDARGALKETPERTATTGTELAEKGADAADRVIADLRARHPTATSSEIMNYLITAYCPVINRQTRISEVQKREKIEAFNRQIGKILFR